MNIKGATQEITGWRRYIYFEYQGKDYGVVLSYDEHQGYDLIFQNENEKEFTYFEMPDWANNWEPELHNDMGLEHYLDELTYELEGVK